MVGIKRLMLALLVAVLWPTLACASEAVVRQYKTDMDAQRYTQAGIQAEKLVQLVPDSALNWYRLARAKAFANEAILAGEALEKALTLDPRMSFTADPARVKTLRDRIQSSMPVTTTTAPLASATSSVAGLQAEPIGQIQSTSNEPSLIVTASAMRAVDYKAPAVDLNPELVRSLLDLEKVSEQERKRQWAIVLAGLAVLLAFGIVGLAMLWQRICSANDMLVAKLTKAETAVNGYVQLAKATIRSQEAKIGHVDVFEAMLAVQREADYLRRLLAEQGLQESEIYTEIERVMPVLSSNIGMAPLRELRLRGINFDVHDAATASQRVMETILTGRHSVSVPPTVLRAGRPS